MRKMSGYFVFLIAALWIGCGDENDAAGGDGDAGSDMVDTSTADADTQTQDEETDTGASLCGSAQAACRAGEIAECDDLGDPELVGHLAAKCKEDCSGWDTSKCLSPEEMIPYGEIEVTLGNDFTLDIEKIGDTTYQDEHLSTIIATEAAFFGVVGGVEFPPPGVQDYEILVLRNEGPSGGEFAITQQAFDADGRLVNPTIQLSLPMDNYTTGGEIEVCLGQKVIIYVYDLNPATFQINCFHAVTADGWLDVGLAEGLTRKDGGKLHLESRDVLPLYYMKNTPHGDFEEQLEYPVCGRLDAEGDVK